MGFNEIVGQDGLIKVLKSSLKEDNLSHAILIKGPAGSGKSTLAMILAGALNCEGAEKPCEECISCRRLVTNEHPDIKVIEAEGRNIKIDQIREARVNFYYFTHGSGVRVCLIKDAHKLTGEAAALLLKVLEEPPDGLVFILTTSFSSMLPGTILSRCQHFSMKKVEAGTMREFLKKKKPETSAEAIDFAVKVGEGVPGRALSVLDDPLWQENQGKVVLFANKLFTGKLSEMELLAEAKDWSGNEDLNILLELFSYFIKDGLFWNMTRQRDLITDDSTISFWEESFLESTFLKSSLELLNDIRQQLRTNVNVNLALDTLFMQIKGRLEGDV